MENFFLFFNYITENGDEPAQPDVARPDPAMMLIDGLFLSQFKIYNFEFLTTFGYEL